MSIGAITTIGHRATINLLALDMSLRRDLRQPLIIIVSVQPCSLCRLVGLNLRQDLFYVRIRGEFVLKASS